MMSLSYSLTYHIPSTTIVLVHATVGERFCKEMIVVNPSLNGSV